MARIFISYKRVDKDKVFLIKDRIEAALGEQCWIDLGDIEGDAQFANVIIRAINDAEIILFMYSKAHVEINDYDNDRTIRELNFANNRGKRIIFVNIDSAPLTDWFDLMFGLKQQVDATSKDAVDRLIFDLQKWLAVPVIHTTEQTEPKKNVQNFQRTKRDAHLFLKWKTHKKWFITVLCVMVAVAAIVGWVMASSSSQERYAKGVEAYKNKDYEKAAIYVPEAAEQGNTDTDAQKSPTHLQRYRAKFRNIIRGGLCTSPLGVLGYGIYNTLFSDKKDESTNGFENKTSNNSGNNTGGAGAFVGIKDIKVGDDGNFTLITDNDSVVPVEQLKDGPFNFPTDD